MHVCVLMCSNSVYAIGVSGEIIPFGQFSICMVLLYHIFNKEYFESLLFKCNSNHINALWRTILSSCNFFLSYTILRGASCDEIRARLIRVYFPRNHPFMATKNNNKRKIFSTNVIWLLCLTLDFLSQYHQINSSNSRDE